MNNSLKFKKSVYGKCEKTFIGLITFVNNIVYNVMFAMNISRPFKNKNLRFPSNMRGNLYRNTNTRSKSIRIHRGDN